MRCTAYDTSNISLSVLILGANISCRRVAPFSVVLVAFGILRGADGAIKLLRLLLVGASVFISSSVSAVAVVDVSGVCSMSSSCCFGNSDGY